MPPVTLTVEQLLDQARERLAAAITARNSARDAVNTYRERILAAPSVSEADEAEGNQLIAARVAADATVDVCNQRVQELVAEQTRDAAVDALQAETVAASRRPAYDQVARVGAEARTYRPDTDPGGRTFLRDVGQAFLHGQLAGEPVQRLQRHMAEERVERAHYMERAAGTGAFAGLTVPQYLTDAYAPLARAMRPFADACNRHDLPPDGMTLNLSRITTGTATALQATENTAVQNTDIDDTLLTINVQTNAGQQTLSRQAIERGTGTEDVTVQDLYRAYATTLDNTLINQAATGLAASATTITYTDASPTGPEMYAQIVAGLSGVEAVMLNMASGDNIAVMHSRRWYKLQSSLSATFPLIAQPGIIAQMTGANYAETYGGGARGLLPNGTPVIVDNNVVTNLGVGTNQDEIYVADRQECHLWEDPAAPVFIRAEQPAAASLGVLFVLYGFFAYTFGRYPGQNQKVTGTGLVTPVFDGT